MENASFYSHEEAKLAKLQIYMSSESFVLISESSIFLFIDNIKPNIFVIPIKYVKLILDMISCISYDSRFDEMRKFEKF